MRLLELFVFGAPLVGLAVATLFAIKLRNAADTPHLTVKTDHKWAEKFSV